MKHKTQRTLIAISLFIATSAWSPARSLAADLSNIRVKPQPELTDIVLDLTGPASDIDVDQSNPQRVTIQFPGHIKPSVKGKSQTLTGHRNLRSMAWDTRDGKVQLFIKRQAPSAVKVFALHNPERILISVNEMMNADRTSIIAPGVVYHHIAKAGARGPLNINVLEIDPKNPEVSIEPALATNRIHGKAKVSQMVNQRGALAGINASFFKPDSGTVLGAVILNKELITGPIYNRVSLGMSNNKQLQMARIALRGKLSSPTGDALTIHNVNQPRLAKGEYILYSSRWGSMAPDTSSDYVQIQINNNRILATANQRLPIPEGGYVLVGPAEGLASQLQPNDAISLQMYTVPDWSNIDYAISGGPYLVKEGQIFVDAHEESFRPSEFNKPAPRTAVGFTADNHLLMVTVDGRQSSSVGVTLYEMARLMKDLGAVEAMNFDGGSSTQMVIKGRVVNSPSVAGGARVSSSLLVRQVPPPLQSEVIGASNNAQSHTDF